MPAACLVRSKQARCLGGAGWLLASLVGPQAFSQSSATERTIAVEFLERHDTGMFMSAQRQRVAIRFRLAGEVSVDVDLFSTDGSEQRRSSTEGALGQSLILNPRAAVTVTADPGHVRATVERRTFRQVIEITTDGRTCAAQVSYELKPGEPLYVMGDWVSDLSKGLASVSADGPFVCSLPGALSS